MERVKVSQELAEMVNPKVCEKFALCKRIAEIYKEGTVSAPMCTNPAKAAKKLLAEGFTFDDAMMIALGHYEVTLTPQEKAVDVYKQKYEEACTTCHNQKQWHANGFMDGMTYMNEMFELGIKFEETEGLLL